MHDLLRSRFEGLVYLSTQQVVTKMVNNTKRENANTKRNIFQKRDTIVKHIHSIKRQHVVSGLQS